MGGKVAGGLPVAGVPDDRQAQTDQPERHQAGDGAFGAGAGLADAGQMSGVQECGFRCPAVAVAFDDLGWGGGQVGGDQGQLVAVGGADRPAEHDLDGLGFERAIPLAADCQHLPLQGRGVAAHLDGGPPVAGHGGQHDKLREAVAFDPWAAPAAGWGRGWLVQGSVAAQPRGHGHLGGECLQRFADVGGVADQVDGALPDMLNDQVEQFAGQHQGGVVGVAGDPQPGEDRQADRPAHKRRPTDDADHHPAVAPGGPVTCGAVAVMMPGGAMELAARAAPQRVVDRQHDRGADGDQRLGDEVQQEQADLVSRPACGRKEPVGQVVVAAAGQPRPGQHAGDRPQARLDQEPGHQRLEGREGPGGKAGRERGQQGGQRVG